MQVHGKATLWLALAVIAGALAVLTAIVPDWIESTVGVDPDGGNGSFEWLIVVALAGVSALSWVRVARLRAAGQS